MTDHRAALVRRRLRNVAHQLEIDVDARQVGAEDVEDPSPALVVPFSVRPDLQHDAQISLLHELKGQETPRSESLGLLEGALESVGGRVTSVRLGSEEGGPGIAGWLNLETPAGAHVLAAAPAQAVAAAVRLAVPLLVDPVLFDLSTQRTPLEAAVANVLKGLDR